MFVSDRELRRPPGGGGKKAPGGGGAGRKDEIVEKARLEREHRELLRLQTAKAVVVQSFWRGRHASHLLLRGLMADTEKKLADLERVTVMLKTTKGIDFVPPFNVVTGMLPPFVYSCKKNPSDKTVDVVNKFCALIICPMATQEEQSKNVLSYFCDVDSTGTATVKRCALLRDLMRVLLNALGQHRAEKPVGAVIDCIKKLLGFKSPMPESIATMNKAVQLEVLDRFYWFQSARAVMVKFVSPLLKPLVSDENGLSDIKALPVYKTAQLICSELYIISIWLVDSPSMADAKISFYLSQLGRDIFTIPVLSTLLSGAAIETLVNWRLKRGLLGRWSVPSLALPPSPHEAFHSGHWLVGNLTGLCSEMCAGSSSPLAGGVDKENLSLYLAAIIPLLLKYYIPGVLKSSRNGGGIVWMRSGVQLVASGIPVLLQEQLLKLLEPDFCRLLYTQLLVPLRQEVATMGTAADKKTVAEALSSSGVRMLKESVIEKTAENNKWLGSKWASKISSGISRMFGVGSSEQSQAGAADFMASTIESAEDSKRTADGPVTALKTFQQPLPDTNLAPDINMLASMYNLWSILLPQASLSSLESKSWKNLSSFAFSTRVVDRVWVSIHLLDLERYAANFLPSDITTQSKSQEASALICLAAILKIVLVAVDDSEMYEHGYPLPLHQILRLIRCLKVMLYKSLQENPSALVEPPEVSVAAAASTDPIANQRAVQKAVEAFYRYHALRVISDVLNNLFTRWARRPFAFSDLWEISDTNSRRFKGELMTNLAHASAVLTTMPWCIEFHERLLFFRTTVDAERRTIQGSDTDPTYRSMGTSIRIRKTMALEDGMNAMDHLSVAALKDRIVVHYVNEFGEEEKGIDAGGLFKDFWTDISNRVFNPSFGLFSVTDSQLLYPNHNALALYPKDEIEKLYYFVGRVLGKALFENMTVQPQFAHFFLAYINGRYNFTNLIDDLSTFDPELYKNLMFLKSYEGDLADLCLTFSVSDDAYGDQKEVDLVPGGSNMAVASHNRHRYINLIAKYYLHDRIHLQAGAFFRGLNQVIRPDQLCIFCAPELQVLISGTSSGISVEDLRANTQYAGGYHPVDRTVAKFWKVVESLEEADRALLLKFVTSCERPPSLGFSALQPPFTIQRVESDGDSRLPTASTCFNILKLPAYSSSAALKDKLLLAIRSRSGFDLS